MGKQFFPHCHLLLRTLTTTTEYALSSLRRYTIPDPASANKSVFCRGLRWFDFFFSFGLILVNRVTCVLAPSSCPVPHPLPISHYPCTRSIRLFTFKEVFTVAALSCAGSIIGSFHQCTRTRVCACVRLSLLNVNFHVETLLKCRRGILRCISWVVLTIEAGWMDQERLLLRVAAANESRCKRPLAVAGPAGTHCSGSIALRIGARRCRTLVLSLEAIAALVSKAATSRWPTAAFVAACRHPWWLGPLGANKPTKKKKSTTTFPTLHSLPFLEPVLSPPFQQLSFLQKWFFLFRAPPLVVDVAFPVLIHA